MSDHSNSKVSGRQEVNRRDEESSLLPKGISNQEVNPMSLVEWLEYHNDQGNALAEIHKDSLHAIFKRQVTPFKKKFSKKDRAHARRTKAVVQQFHQIFVKTIENLTQLDTAMLKEFKEKFPGMDEDWSNDVCSIVSSSSLNGDVRSAVERIRNPSCSGSNSSTSMSNQFDVLDSVTLAKDNTVETDTNLKEMQLIEEMDQNEGEDISIVQVCTESESEVVHSDTELSHENSHQDESDGEGYGSDKTVLMNKNKSQVKKKRSFSRNTRIKKGALERKTKAEQVAVKKEKLISKEKEESGNVESDLEDVSEEPSENKDTEVVIEDQTDAEAVIEDQIDAEAVIDDQTDAEVVNCDQTNADETITLQSQSLLNTSMELFSGDDIAKSDVNFHNAEKQPTEEEIIDTIQETQENLAPLDNNYFTTDVDMLDLLGLTQTIDLDVTPPHEEDDEMLHANPPSPTETVFLPVTNFTRASTPIPSESPTLLVHVNMKLENTDTRIKFSKSGGGEKESTNNTIDQEESLSNDILETNSGEESALPEKKVFSGENTKKSTEKIDSTNKGVSKLITKSKKQSPDLPDVLCTATVVIDNEKPSTSKKVVAELERNQRRAKRSVEDKRRPKLSKEEEEARRDVLSISSDDEIGASNDPTPKISRKKLSKPELSVGTDYDQKNDHKLNYTAQVKIDRLASEIENALKNTGFIKLKKLNEGESDSDSDSSVRKLDRAIKQLTRYNPIVDGKSRCTKLRKGTEHNSNPRRKKKQIEGEESLKSSEDEEEQPKSDGALKIPVVLVSSPATNLIEGDDLSGSDIELMDDEDAAKKKALSMDKKVEERKAKADLKNQKKYVTPQVDISSSSESEKETRKKVLAKDSDCNSSDQEVRKSKKTVKNDYSDDSDDFVATKRTTKKKKLKSKQVLSDSDYSDENTKGNKEKASDSESEMLSIHDSDSDSDFKMKKKKTKRKNREDSSTDEDRKRKKKRKRIKEERDSDASSIKSNDSDVQEIEAIPSSQKRKKIRGIMTNKDLQKSTREAEKEEEERKKRVSEKQKLFNGMFETPVAEGGATSADKGSLKRLILDIDPITKEPLIEVEESIVAKLKPHQADGIKFMYTTCFESVEMIKKNKAGGCILAHCMGLGKTLQTVAFTHTILCNKALTGVRTVLVVCPLNTVNNWYKEYIQWLRETDKSISLHSLWDGKTIRERVDALKVWQKRGGVGIIHYDLFRNLANTAVGKGAGKKLKQAHRESLLSDLLDPGPDMIICDEGHLLKNFKSKLTLALSKIKTIRRIVLTGTPLQNNLIEYHTMVNFVKPNLLGSLKEFTNRFVNPIKNGQCKDSGERDVKVMKRRAHVLHSKLDGCVQRLDYSVLTPYLPPKYEYCIIIKLSEKQKELYRKYLSTQVSEDTTERARRILQHYAVLIKILAHPIVLTMKKATADSEAETDEEGSLKDFIDDDGDVTEAETSGSSGSDVECLDGIAKKTPLRKTRSCKEEIKDPCENEPEKIASKESLGNDWWCSLFQNKEEMYDVQLSGKLVVLQEILKICETIGDKVLVFSQYLTTLNIIEEFLAEWDLEAKKKNGDEPRTYPPPPASSAGRWRHGTEYFRIDGRTKSVDRQKYCDIFNKKSSCKGKLFLISTKAGGLGINLFGANRVVIFDASWNPSNDMQSIFRVFRFGQEKPCYIYRFVAQATMEEKIYNRQVVKLSLSSRVVDEHQVERHFKFDDITEMYKYNPDEKSERPTPPLPKDRLLANLLISHKDWIDSYFEHDTLLVNKQDEELTEEERRHAWEEYRTENERQVTPGLTANDLSTLHKIKARLMERFPQATEEYIHANALLVLSKINELRTMLHRFNMAIPTISIEERLHTEKSIKALQDWIALILNGSIGSEATEGTTSSNAQTTYSSRVTSSSRLPSAPPPMIRMPTMAPGNMQRLMMSTAERIVNSSYNNPQHVNRPTLPWIPSYAQTLPYAPNGPTNMNGALGGPDSPLTLD